MSRKDQRFFNRPDIVALISSSGYISTKPPTNTGLADNFKFTYLPAGLFKKSIERDAVLFTTFEEVTCWDAWRRNILATTRAQDTEEVLNSDHCSVNADDVNIFKEKQKFTHAVFCKTLQTDRGNKYMKEHESHYDDQSVCVKI